MQTRSGRLTAPVNLVLLALALVLGVGCVFLLLRPDLGVALDAALYLHGAERMLAGGQLYIDFVDINPPLAVWLHVPPIILSQLTGLSPISSFLLLMILATALSSLAGYKVLTREGEGSLPAGTALLLALSVPSVLVMLDQEWQLGQRSALLVIALFPYLAVRMRRSIDGQVSGSLAFAVGVATGVILSLKPPHYVSILLPAEIYLLYRAGNIRFWFQAETWGVVFAVACYAVYLLFFLPEASSTTFFDGLLPLIVDTYQDLYGNNPDWLIRTSFKFLLLPLLTVTAVWFLLRDSKNRAVQDLATIACLTGWAGAGVYLAQAKGWEYHAIPSWFAASMAGFLFLGSLIPGFLGSDGKNRTTAILATSVVGVFLIFQTLGGAADLGDKKRKSELGELVLEHTEKGDYIYVMSTGVDPSFPLVQQLERKFATRFPFAFLVPMSYYGAITDESARHGYRPAAKFAAYEEQFLTDLNADLLADKPQLIVTRRSCFACPHGMEFVDYVENHADTLTAFANYTKLERTSKFDVWVYSGAGK